MLIFIFLTNLGIYSIINRIVRIFVIINYIAYQFIKSIVLTEKLICAVN